MDIYAQKALAEYNETPVHPGGVNGTPFWNLNSSQFLFVPAFQFPKVPRATGYRFTAVDKNGVSHSFDAKAPTEALKPIWAQIPTGIVRLTVESLDKEGKPEHVVGARTFYKAMPFPGRDALPPKARSYRECALKAFRYIFEDEATQYWLTHGVPKPDYPHNVYPAKTIDAIMRAMTTYATLEPKNAESALKLACRAADYLLSISFPKGHPLEGLPPTYSFEGLDAESVNKVAPAAQGCVGTTMMIYPVSAGMGYLALYDATKDEKYWNAVMTIANYYKENVLECGSWYLLYDCESGKPLSNNICVDFKFVHFFHTLYEKTKDETWRTLEIGCYKYITEVCLKTYKWEGQFEDVAVSGNYVNLTHFTANNLIGYVNKNLRDDEAMRAEALELMRFVEDQFVVWGEIPDWNRNFISEIWDYPAGLEQYFCYVPIDSSTCTIMRGFIDAYELTGDRTHLEKAMALGNTITRVQNVESGQVPTFFIGEGCAYGYENFWINCLLYTASAMLHLAEVTEAAGIE